MHALVVRGNRALVKPEASPGCPIPTVDEVIKFMVVIDSYQYDDIIVVTSFTGQAPVAWRWIGVLRIQKELNGALNSELADKIGEAMLCGGTE